MLQGVLCFLCKMWNETFKIFALISILFEIISYTLFV